MKSECISFFKYIQDEIVHKLEDFDGCKFHEDLWFRPEGGGGRTRVLTEGNIFEKAGVNFSEVHGEFSDEFAKTMPGEGRRFFATGVSLVLHPRNPFVPTVHANFRYIVKGSYGWFGGGGDLTPYYPFVNDAVHFHRTWKSVCQMHPDIGNH